MNRLFFALLLIGAGIWWMQQRSSPGRLEGKEGLQAALARAQSEDKRVLVVVSAESCIWCERFAHAVEADPEIKAIVEKSFLTVRLDHRADAGLLTGYPPIDGTPHLFVLAKEGTLACSQATEPLESGKSYDREKLLSFFKTWAR
ncbi:MAG: thioredoxin family protein [Elusimicrobiota bacterium]|jgi:hypothetical protein